jgi:hypothetical protein
MLRVVEDDSNLTFSSLSGSFRVPLSILSDYSSSRSSPGPCFIGTSPLGKGMKGSRKINFPEPRDHWRNGQAKYLT